MSSAISYTNNFDAYVRGTNQTVEDICESIKKPTESTRHDRYKRNKLPLIMLTTALSYHVNVSCTKHRCQCGREGSRENIALCCTKSCKNSKCFNFVKIGQSFACHLRENSEIAKDDGGINPDGRDSESGSDVRGTIKLADIDEDDEVESCALDISRVSNSSSPPPPLPPPPPPIEVDTCSELPNVQTSDVGIESSSTDVSMAYSSVKPDMGSLGVVSGTRKRKFNSSDNNESRTLLDVNVSSKRQHIEIPALGHMNDVDELVTPITSPDMFTSHSMSSDESGRATNAFSVSINPNVVLEGQVETNNSAGVSISPVASLSDSFTTTTSTPDLPVKYVFKLSTLLDIKRSQQRGATSAVNAIQAAFDLCVSDIPLVSIEYERLLFYYFLEIIVSANNIGVYAPSLHNAALRICEMKSQCGK